MKKHNVIITGGISGIGYGIAKILAQDGNYICIADIKSETEVDKEIRALESMGGKIIYCKTDITSALDRVKLIESVKRNFGVPDVLINNAGVAPRVRADILTATEESYDFVMNVNLKAPYFLTQSVAKEMIEEKKRKKDFYGYIINISSISAEVASVSRGEYCISKAGLSMATKLWAVRLAEYEINVYEIRPGIIKTPMTAPVKEKYDKLIQEGLLLQPRWGEPEDIGKVVRALISGDFQYSTGQVIYVDGGFIIRKL